MAAEWRNFKTKVKTKRTDQGKGKKKDTVCAFNEENDTSRAAIERWGLW